MTVPWRTKGKPEYVKHERTLGKKKGARLQKNSGRLWHSLRDVIQETPLGFFLIDAKSGKDGPLKSYRITEDDWKALKRDANRTPPGCHPVLHLRIGPYRLMVIEEDLWDEVGEMLGD